MARYIVEPAAPPPSNDRRALEKALRDLIGLVEDFSRANAGKVKILQGTWLNATLRIETDDETARSLAHVPGIGKVEKPRPIRRD